MLSFPNDKINLGLNITEKRGDGYHNIETIFYPIKLNDAVEITDADTTSCNLQGINIPGETQNNLCLMAYQLLKQDFDIPPQQITLLKNIPVGAGLGGGSADAAFVIKLLNQKFNLNLSIADMEAYARKLGADCAFFIANTPVFAHQKGDEFEPCEVDLSAYFKVLVKPPIHVSTADAYALVKPQKPLQSLKEIIHLPPTAWKNKMLNDFETSVFAKHPQISAIKQDLYAAGAVFALMSGSGSSVFALFNQVVKLPLLAQDNQVYYGV